MLSVFDGLRSVTTLSVFVRLACAFICGGIIGIERSYKRRPAGFRTHILICIGAAITTLTSQYLYLNMHYFTDMARLGAQVVAGIGFIGAGTHHRHQAAACEGTHHGGGTRGPRPSSVMAFGGGFYEGGILATGFIMLWQSRCSRGWSTVMLEQRSRDQCVYGIPRIKRVWTMLLQLYRSCRCSRC